jgi:hypothetical protein
MYFGAGNSTIQVEGDFGDSEGFASEELLGSRGFYTWSTADTLGTLGETNSSVQVSLSLIVLDGNNSGIASRQQGPTVTIRGTLTDATSSPRLNVLVVALPSMLGISILVIACSIWVVHQRRRGASIMPASLRRLFKFPGTYSDRQQRSNRFHKPAPRMDKSISHYDIQLTNRDSWSATSLGREPHPGRNVFRDEIARQDRERG